MPWCSQIPRLTSWREPQLCEETPFWAQVMRRSHALVFTNTTLSSVKAPVAWWRDPFLSTRRTKISCLDASVLICWKRFLFIWRVSSFVLKRFRIVFEAFLIIFGAFRYLCWSVSLFCLKCFLFCSIVSQKDQPFSSWSFLLKLKRPRQIQFLTCLSALFFVRNPMKLLTSLVTRLTV